MRILKQATAVDVIIGPFVDNTDGDTEETALTINASDVKLSKNGQTMAGKNDVTACVHDANGMYNCELDATDTNTIGIITIFVHVTGALAVRHDFQIVEEAVYDAMFADGSIGPLQSTTGGRTLDVTAGGAAGIDWGNVENTGATVDLAATSTALVDVATAVTDQVAANVTSISGDTTAADNLEAMYDGTGYNADTAPASRSQVGALATGSAAISTVAESYVLTTGTQSSGTLTDTETRDGTRHEHTDAAGVMDLYYQFDVGGNGIAVEADIYGYLTGSNDTLLVMAYDWVGTTWDQVGTWVGTNGATDSEMKISLLNRHTGSGNDAGKVRIRLYAASGLTSAVVRVDQISMAYTVISQSVGYAGGAIWVDTNNGTAGTEPYVNGTADRPVLTYADAVTLATTLGLSRFRVINGSSITFTGTHDNESWEGDAWDLAFNGQNITASFIRGARISGTFTATNKPHIEHCVINGVTADPCRINGSSGFSGSLTLATAGDYDIINCTSLVAGGASPTIDLGLGVGPCNLNIRGWTGGMTFTNIEAGDTISLEGVGGTVTVNGSGGTINVRGIFENVVDNSGATVDVTQTAAISRASIAGYDQGAVWIDTLGGTAGTIEHVNGTADNPVNSIADATTLATSLGYRSLTLLRGSSVSLPQAYAGFSFRAGGASIALNGQNVGGAVFEDALITGTGTGASQVLFGRCKLTGVSVPSAGFLNCAVSGTLTLLAGEYTLERCYDSDDAGAATLDFGGATGDTSVQVHEWGGNLQIENLGANGTDDITISIAGPTFTIAATCVGGTVNIAGTTVINDLSGGAVTINRDAQFDRAPITAIQSDVTSIKEITDSAERGAAIAGTLSTTQMSTDLTEVTNDHYIGRLLTFTSGPLNKQQTDVTDYDGASKVLTFTALTEAPAAGTTFILS